MTITTNGIMFELQLQPKNLTRDLDGRRVAVQVRLTQRRGVERRVRFTAEVRSIKAVRSFRR
ncbi:MAG: hypothetical protein ACM3SO_12130 [Betaproteobacteria bacterium]